jgi:transaldolase
MISPAIHTLAAQGQSLWLDNINRSLIDSGTLGRYIQDDGVTGLTSNPSIFDHALRHSIAYDDQIHSPSFRTLDEESAFFSLAITDLTRAAQRFLSVHRRTAGLDGWVSLEVSPRLAHAALRTFEQVWQLHSEAALPNLMIKIPGTSEGCQAITKAITSSVPVNVTLLFSAEQYKAAADAYMSGLEQRLAAGESVDILSVASVFISRWDVALNPKLPDTLRNRLGITVAQTCYQAFQEIQRTPRWQHLADAGAPTQRLLWASTGTKDPELPEDFYVSALVAPQTINTLPEKTLQYLAQQRWTAVPMATDSDALQEILASFATAGIDIHAEAKILQEAGAEAFVEAWTDLLQTVARKMGK